MSIRRAAEMFVEHKASLTVPEMLAPRVDADGPDGKLAMELVALAERCRSGEIGQVEARHQVAALLKKH